MSNKIFVQIASYRDPQLLPTIRDCLSNAHDPNSISFGICWQRDDSETLAEFANDNRFRILDYHWSKSKGLCWARSEIQKLWQGESFTLQLDSHHRFAKNWDLKLVEMMNMTGSKKPIITSYAGMYNANTDELLNIEPYKMVASNFTSGGTIIFRPHVIENWENLKKPIPARFVSGHFFFTIGEHCKEYKYDPNIYFAGDEISLSIRSYTLGYDLFHPHRTIIWHEYTREGRTKHWSDFNKENVEAKIVDQTWWEMDNYSKKRLRHMLREEDNNIDLSIYGLGNIRSHHDYEIYAGIDFGNKKLHRSTLKGIDPPVNDLSEWYKSEEIEYHLSVSLPSFSKKNKFVYLGIEDEKGDVIYRKDLFDYDSGTVNISFKSFNKPYKSVIWPVDENDQWYERKDTLL